MKATIKQLMAASVILLSSTASAAWTNGYVIAASPDSIVKTGGTVWIEVTNDKSGLFPRINVKHSDFKKDKPATNNAVIVVNGQPINVTISTNGSDIANFDTKTKEGNRFILDAIMAGGEMRVITSDSVDVKINLDGAAAAISKTKFAL